MAAYSGPPLDQEASDLGDLWSLALIEYKAESDIDLSELEPSKRSMRYIMAERDHQVQLFNESRHNKGKVDKLRTYVAKNSEIIQTVAGHIANAASTAFPPSAAILTAFNLVMNASRAVSEDYDMVVSFFEIMNSFLERISMLEGRMPDISQFRKSLVNVFRALLTLCAIARKYRVSKGRLIKWAKALIDGNDPKLKGAFDRMHTEMQRLESATLIATLRETLDTGKKVNVLDRDIKAIRAGVGVVIEWEQQNFAIGQQNLANGQESLAIGQRNLELGQQNHMVQLEMKGIVTDVGANTQEVLKIVARQEDEQSAVFKRFEQKLDRSMRKALPRDKAGGDHAMDAGTRKSTALKRLGEMMGCEDDTKVQLEDIENAYVDGTFKWFKDEQVYSQFQDGEKSLLWITGPPGTGKSTLTYTTVRNLTGEFYGDASTSVAHFFFREDGTKFRTAERMLKSCALQIARHDIRYREELLTDLQKIERKNAEDMGDPEKLWEVLFVSKFPKDSRGASRRAILILDGVDQAEEKSAEQIKTFLTKVSDSSLDIGILFTSDPSYMDDSNNLEMARFRLEPNNQNLRKDMRVIALFRMKKLPRLRNLRPDAKRKIARKLRLRADSIQYIEHVLRKFNTIGREGPIMKELEKLPDNIRSLYHTMLGDCEKSRTTEDLDVLRRFFAWLAYANEPLRHASASHLLSFIAKDNKLSIDEEVDHASARILRLSGAALNDEGETDTSDHEAEKPEDDAKSSDDEDSFRDDVDTLLSFQERSLRKFFREKNPDPSGLRTPPSVGHLMIFEAIGSILTKPHDGSEQFDFGEHWLGNYATGHWMDHLLQIDGDDLTDEQAAAVIECLYGILSNRNNALKMIEVAGDYEKPSIFGAIDEGHEKALAALKQWSIRASRLTTSKLSTNTMEWMRPFIRNPKIIYIKTAESHVANWFFKPTFDFYAERSFRCAHRALELGKDLVQQHEQLHSYFDERAKDSDAPLTEKSILVVSKAFWQMQMTMTAQCYRAIGMAMKNLDFNEASLEQFKLGLENCDNDRDRLQISLEMGEALISLAVKAEEEAKAAAEAEAEAKVKGEAEIKAGSRTETKTEAAGPDHADHTNGEDGERQPNGESSDKPKQIQSPEQRKAEWAQKACEVLAAAGELQVQFSKDPKQDRTIKLDIISTYSGRITAELLLGQSGNVVQYFETARKIPLKSSYFSIEEAVSRLGTRSEWDTIIELFRALDKNNRLYFLWNTYSESSTQLMRAAKETHHVDLIAEAYQDAISMVASLYEPTWATEMMLPLGELYRTVVGGQDGLARAKTLLYEVTKRSNSTVQITDATFHLADILVEQFRHTNDPNKKVAAYTEMKQLVSLMRDNIGKEFDPTQSQTTIPLALMAQKLAAVEFQNALEATFQGCVAALSDESSWNDSISFRTLAKVLACAGLGHEAEIAATCQLYIIDVEIHRRENSIGEEESKVEENGDKEESRDKVETSSSPEEGPKEGVEGQTKLDSEVSSTGANGVVTLPSHDLHVVPAANPDAPEADPKPNGNTKSEDAATETKPEIDSDLDPIYGSLTCNNCKKTVTDWRHGAMYLCYYCTELNLCEECYDKKVARERGDLPADWRTLCPEGHRHVKAPVEGWKGVKDGVLCLGDSSVAFKDWLTELRYKKWTDAWERFWSEETKSN